MTLKPYIISEENEASTTYEYNILYSWAALVLIVLIFIAIITNNMSLQIMSVILIAFYIAAKLILGRNAIKTIKSALKSSSVEVSGSKYSFSKPLKIKVQKNA